LSVCVHQAPERSGGGNMSLTVIVIVIVCGLVGSDVLELRRLRT
jgi:hypothetical protein